MHAFIHIWICMYLIVNYLFIFYQSSFQQAGLNNAYWRFALLIEEAVGTPIVVTAHCLLCHWIMKLSSIRQGVAHHIGDQRCQKLTPYALQLYGLIVENEKRKGVKRKPNILMTDHKSHGKSPQIGTSVNTRRTHRINHFEDISWDLDEVLTRASEIRVPQQTTTI